MLAPLALSGGGFRSFATLTGRFCGRGPPDYAFLAGSSARTGPDRLALSLGEASPPGSTRTLVGATLLSGVDGSSATLVAGDFDGDGRDELAALDHSGALAAFAAGTCAGPESPLGADSTAWKRLGSSTVAAGGGALIARDLDGDGRADLLFAAGGRGFVAFGGPTGLGHPEELPSELRVLGAAPAQLDRDPELEVVLLVEGPDGRSLVALDLDPATRVSKPIGTIAPAPGAREIGALDLDGDGLDDLAWIDGLQVFVLHAIAQGALGQ
jgi:hypothetical protein